jgi:predicted alpha-1,2-mannosidase
VTTARFSLAMLAVCAACKSNVPSVSPSHEVRPLVGAGGLGYAVGSIPPGPTLPFGLAKPGPDTATDGSAPDFAHCAGYWYEDKEIRGFSQIHLSGTGVPDYGILMVMPMLDLPAGAIEESTYAQQLDHHLERAEVGYYDVKLLPSAIEVEVSATLRTSIYRVRYPAGREANLIVSLAHSLNGETRDSSLEIDAANRTVSGFVLNKGGLSRGDGNKLFFAARFEQPFTRTETYLGRDRTPGATSAGGAGGAGAILSFGPELAGPLRFQIGLSFIDVATAKANLQAEWVDYDLERARTAARAAWDELLRIIEIEGGSPAHRQTFYSALYHVHFMPTLFTEAGSRYRGIDGQLHTADGFTYFTDFSLWDTFRSFHPLITLIEPERELDFVKSLLAMTEQTGSIPKWVLGTAEVNVMIGYHGETVLADSYLSGLRDFDVEKAYAFIRAAAMDPRLPNAEKSLRKRDCLEAYLDHGFCPADVERGSASKTLENSFEDFVAAQLADALGHHEDAAVFRARAQSWRKLANSTGLVQGRNADGTFVPGFREDLFGKEFVEGNSRQWSTFVPHDVQGLADVRGGADQAVAYLEALFDNAAAAERSPLPDLWFWAGNEPDIHAPYLFAELGRPDLTAKWVAWTIDHRFDPTPAGLPGNDDGGTMSAWYVFSALGLYPKVGEARYVLGRPLFPKATVHVGTKTISIVALGLTDKTTYVKSIRWNGRVISGPFISHDELSSGGELVFEMSETP